MSPGSSTESYPAFAHIWLRKNPGKNLNQTKIDRTHLNAIDLGQDRIRNLEHRSGRQYSLKCATGTRCRPVCTVVQQGEIESIPASSYESTIVHCVFRCRTNALLYKYSTLHRELNPGYGMDDDDDDDDDM
ncbi:hypothetical protein ANN_00286 [Periplaneta americana]|uniref:Uncharacterized protein n=1 Tax=Periplaneta americana TaxID=6978 RepID=A0ABQ8TT88_PERAM|nr:hypothetical protein ANN_00286 [Periplaneta americana]